ncbi:MAG: Rrf2 family transcriptional regulator [Bacillota bacterium]|nr:Rrf2 family transcriptional regulator [Bacillota bacterium]
MRLSTRSRYGLRAMFELAAVFGHGHVSIKHISENQGVPEQYLEQLFMLIRKAGLISSVRGAQGGYELARAPAEITVGDIIRALDGPMAPVSCLSESRDAICGKEDCCVTRLVWQKVQESINRCIDAITLQGMLDDYKNISDANIKCSR